MLLPRSKAIKKWFLNEVRRSIGTARLRLVLKQGRGLVSGKSPVATVFIPDLWTAAELALDPEMAFAEAYSNGRIKVEGNLVLALESVYRTMANARACRWYQRIMSKWMDCSQVNSFSGSRENIHRHYDLGNDFYKLWLDRELVYTCGYFQSPTATLEEAQNAKMDYICRKLDLRAGETVVDAGCGWGALALYLARHYGVSVRAFNVSHQQILHARKRAKEEGLGDRVEFIEDDYRNITGKFDVFVSVGMLEHVGEKHYAELGEVIHRSIGNEGRGLLHFIGKNQTGYLSRWIRKRIFPGAYAPTLRQALELFEPWNYSNLDVENLRLHYAKTLEHWLSRFENEQAQVCAMYDSWFANSWRLYLAGSIAGFRTGTLQLFQVTFGGSDCQPMYWVRDPLYAPAGSTRRKNSCVHTMS